MQANVALQGDENKVSVNRTNFNQRLVSKGPLSLASKSIFAFDEVERKPNFVA